MKSFLRLRSVRIASALAIASGLAGTVGLVASTTSATEAGADPPTATAFVGVGADVSQDLYNALAGQAPNPGPGVTPQYYTPLHSTVATGSWTIQSFDANPQGGTTTLPGNITTKLSGPAYDRPNSSSQGTLALDDSLNGSATITFQNTTSDSIGPVDIANQVDFARTAKGVTNPGSDLTWIPFARDALGILYYNNGTTSATHFPITASELKTLYSSTTGTETINGVTVIACLPISTSSPVSNLAKALSLTATQLGNAATAANCNSNISQNNGNAFVAGLPSGAQYAVIPISSGSWIGQANGVGFDRSATARADGVDLADLTNAAATPVDLGQPYTIVSGKEKPNTNYYQDSTWGYNLSTVIYTKLVSGVHSNKPLDDLFVGPTSELCSSSAQTTVNLFGFDSLTSGEGTCGSTTTEGNN